jgi:hypothetical protein
MLMTNLLLAAMMFLPHQSVKTYAAPDHSCLSTWGGDTNNVQNICKQPITVDIEFKNGQGRHFDLDPFESKDIGQLKVPYIGVACYKGQGSPSMSTEHMQRPGWKDRSHGYACIEVTLEFPMPLQFKDLGPGGK